MLDMNNNPRVSDLQASVEVRDANAQRYNVERHVDPEQGGSHE